MPRAIASALVLRLDRARIGGVDETSVPAMSRAQTGDGSASISARSDSTSPTSFSWRALSSASSRLSPLTSRSRSTARPPIARPSASIARPASVISGMEKGFAVRAQRIDRALHGLRLVGLEPGAEREHALRQRGGGDQRGVAEDVRLVAGRRPGHQDLRLRQQQRVDAVAFGAQRDDVVAADRSAPAVTRSRMRTSRMAVVDAKHQHAEREHKRRDLLRVERGDRIEIERHEVTGHWRPSQPTARKPCAARLARNPPRRG